MIPLVSHYFSEKADLIILKIAVGIGKGYDVTRDPVV
jgi:hypothetical protein